MKKGVVLKKARLKEASKSKLVAKKCLILIMARGALLKLMG